MWANHAAQFAAVDSLTAAEIALIRESYDQVSVGRRLSRNFYTRLFEIAPELRARFPDDLAPQQAKLMEMLSILVNTLDRPAELATLLGELGVRHVSYGVTAPQFAPVGRALFDTLEAELGPAFDAPTRGAWIALYALASTLMHPSAVTAATL